MPIRPFDLSRFFQTEPVIRNGIETFGLWSRPDFLVPSNLNDDDLVKISVDGSLAGRPDLIALQEYETPLLEWVVVMFNRPLNPLGWPQVGTVIKIPKRSAVTRNI